MDEERWSLLEKRIAALEAARADTAAVTDHEAFWALRGVKERSDGRSVLLWTGAVDLPGGERYEWQEAADAASVLDADPTVAVAALSALAHPVRLGLLLKVLQGRRTVTELGEGLGTSGQLYHHLRQLTEAGWLDAVGRGTYAVPGARVVPLLTLLATAGLR
ncbi:ArsR/SmtB family transcription factor [Kineococcus gynurae]|uniref:ArsR/SmtB family transcription factor n=1 Tax=Kineococcus gynurae TaxID=452979 RepID=A0ABV5LN16_9ACTN